MNMRTRRIALYALILTAIFEAITCVLRFGLDLQSTRETSAVARFTFGLRIHHSYPGALLMVVCAFLKPSRLRDVLLIVGIALLASDLIHHFLVLWPITGSPQFDLTYKK